MRRATLNDAVTSPLRCLGVKQTSHSGRRPKSSSTCSCINDLCVTDVACRYLRLNERQAAEIQRAIAAADEADAATSVMRAQMERLRLQMEAQGTELANSQRRLEETTEVLQTHQYDSGVRLQELQSQRDAMAKALRQSRSEADAAAREAQDSNLRREAVEAALGSMGEQVAEYESAKQSMKLQQQALQQQQEELSRRERTADESCRNFAAARAESQAAVVALKAELAECKVLLQRAQAQLKVTGSSQSVLQQLEGAQAQLRCRGRSICRLLSVNCSRCKISRSTGR
jgi:chromosome segregation ATPase